MHVCMAVIVVYYYHFAGNKNVLLIGFIDGARLDEFTCDSGTSCFLQFTLPESASEDVKERCKKVANIRPMLPLVAVAVKYGKGSLIGNIDEGLLDPDHDYMYKLLEHFLGVAQEGGLDVNSVMANHLFRVKVTTKLRALMGDYPSMIRYVNGRTGRCPFCSYVLWHARYDF